MARATGGLTVTRVPPIRTPEGLDADARAVFERIVETRGAILRPFEVLLHSPEAAERVGELGHVIRSGLGLTGADRELATLATGRATGCGFVWDSHVEAARDAGVRAESLEAVDRGKAVVAQRDAAIVAFVRELCSKRNVSEATFEAVRDVLGTRGVIELALVSGYYQMLGAVMATPDAC
jgi:4-carboxymuconolactone decarboxylase